MVHTYYSDTSRLISTSINDNSYVRKFVWWFIIILPSGRASVYVLYNFTNRTDNDDKKNQLKI